VRVDPVQLPSADYKGYMYYFCALLLHGSITGRHGVTVRDRFSCGGGSHHAAAQHGSNGSRMEHGEKSGENKYGENSVL
jgi:hypothetical protein